MPANGSEHIPSRESALHGHKTNAGENAGSGIELPIQDVDRLDVCAVFVGVLAPHGACARVP